MKVARLPVWDALRWPVLDRALRSGEHAPWFPHPAAPSRAQLEARLAEVRKQPIDRSRLAPELGELQRRWGAPPESLEAAASLAHPDTFLVVGGQQAGLLLGPLYTLHKVMTLLAVCRAWNRLGIGRFVPAFWIAADDHDLAEIDHVNTPGREGGVKAWKLKLGPDGAAARAARVPPEAAALVEQLLDEVLGEEAARARRAELLPPHGATMVEWFGRLLLHFFGKRGLVVLEPGSLWKRSGELFARVASEEAALSRLRREQEARMVAGGLVLQAPAGEGLPLFQIDGQGKRRRVPSGDPEKRIAAMRAAPEAFSPDVLLRPALQGALLPVAAQVAGPNEIAYLPQSWPYHEWLGIRPPIVVPRLSATWVEPDQGALLARLGLRAESLVTSPPAYEQAVWGRVPPEIKTHLDSVDESLDGTVSRLEDVGLTLDRNLSPVFAKARERMEQEMDRLKRKVVSAALAKEGLGLRHWERLAEWLRPRGELQERVFGSILPLLRHGPEGVEVAQEALDPFLFEHHIIQF